MAQMKAYDMSMKECHLFSFEPPTTSVHVSLLLASVYVAKEYYCTDWCSQMRCCYDHWPSHATKRRYMVDGSNESLTYRWRIATSFAELFPFVFSITLTLMWKLFSNLPSWSIFGKKSAGGMQKSDLLHWTAGVASSQNFWVDCFKWRFKNSKKQWSESALPSQPGPENLLKTRLVLLDRGSTGWAAYLSMVYLPCSG